MAAAGAGASQKKKRFTVADDIRLLCEVIGRNPYRDTAKWQEIADAMNAMTGKGFSVRAVRERTDYLIKLFRKQDRENLRK